MNRRFKIEIEIDPNNDHPYSRIFGSTQVLFGQASAIVTGQESSVAQCTRATIVTLKASLYRPRVPTSFVLSWAPSGERQQLRPVSA